jgi:hypothetical protein
VTVFEGRCHCGAVTACFETGLAAETIEVRADQCGFCRRHGAKTVSDPAGWLVLAFREQAITRYRFGTRTTDFILCNGCGVYVAAMIDGFGVLNVTGADIRPLAGREAVPVDYDDETPQGRLERRRARWTPLTVELAA